MTIELDETHYRAATERASELGTSTQLYLQSLIDEAGQSVDDLLAPVREQFARSGVTEEELDDAVNEARRAIAGGWRPDRRP